MKENTQNLCVFEVNSVPYGSTGRIMFDIAEKIAKEGGTVYTACSYTKPRGIQFPPYHKQIGGIAGKLIHTELAKRTGKHGMYSTWATKALIRRISKANPDVIHLHNLHGWFLNLPMLFSFLKKYEKPVVWTFHDAWPITGHCTHYLLNKCYRWETQCKNCSIYDSYPMTKKDDSEFQYNLKKEIFNGLSNAVIVTPSKWLAGEVKRSYLKDYPVQVINNGVNLKAFSNVNSTFRKEYNIGEDKIMLLGVAFDWGIRKGLKFFIQLAKELDEKFQIVLVGLSEKEKESVPDNVITIGNVSSQSKLAEIYAAADYFVNLTQEDNFPTVNIESLACGTPVITFPTGGSPEIADEETGWVVADYDDLRKLLDSLGKKSDELSRKCLERGKKYAKEDKYSEYLALFERLKNQA